MRVSYPDRIGEKHNKLLIIGFEHKEKHSLYLCRCDCGTEKYIDCDSVVSGRQQSCGCLRHKSQYLDLTGKRFGRLVVKSYSHKKNKYNYWNCICDCGNSVIVSSGCLLSGTTLSCKCQRKENMLKSRLKHDSSKTRLYHIYNGMKKRCYDTKDINYKRYGERGIVICDEWLDKENGFQNFKNWALSNGYSDNLSIDRIDNNGNYEPSNCRWANDKTQCRNRRSNRLITYNNQTKCISEWSEIFDIPAGKIWYRLSHGYDLNKVFVK